MQCALNYSGARFLSTENYNYSVFWWTPYKCHMKPEKCSSTCDFVTCTGHRLESPQEPRLRTEDTQAKYHFPLHV